MSLIHRFVFADFVLDEDKLFYMGVRQLLPPKEKAVLVVLLEAAGNVVSKDTLLDRVWNNQIVREVSLTRCIHALRRILKESKKHLFIESVYGHGYRFSQPVNMLYDREVKMEECKLAVLPFHLQGEEQGALTAHDTIIQSLHHFKPFGLSILPAALTRDCFTTAQVHTLIKEMRPDFYLTSNSYISAGERVFYVELVQANNHTILHRERIDLSATTWLISLQHRLTALLPRYIPALH
ncbi:MAG: winged helix-turn-helix domain-containing protein, partial [Glaciimonas sp.]|nr:winged helix-turn-helix domain-containing protein [Glaciimonas sp.]